MPKSGSEVLAAPTAAQCGDRAWAHASKPSYPCPLRPPTPLRFAGFFEKLASVDTEGDGSGGAAGGAQAGESVAVPAEDGEVEKEVGAPLDTPQPFEPQGVLGG